MPRPKRLDLDPANVDADGLCQSQTPLAGGSMTINGALTSGGVFDIHLYGGDSDGIGGKKIAFTFAADETGRTFTITGTDQDGLAQTSTVAGAGIGTVQDTKYWRTVTDISIDAASAGAITVGTVDEIITATYALNWRSDDGATVGITGVTGTLQYDIDVTFSPILVDGPQSALWVTSQSNQSTDIAAVVTAKATGVRVKFDSYTDGAELQADILQTIE